MGTSTLRVSAAVLLATLATLAAGCLGSGSARHSTLAPSQAVGQARSDGFVGVVIDHAAASWLCNRHGAILGPAQPTGRYRRYLRPTYSMEFSDPRIPPKDGNTAQAGFDVVVMPTARIAARCARAGIYSDEHSLVHNGQRTLGSHPKMRPYTVISPTIIQVYKAPPGAPGVPAGMTGDYDVWLSHGRVLALGEAYNVPNAGIVSTDLAKLAAQIAG
jgi:hypothetical protein